MADAYLSLEETVEALTSTRPRIMMLIKQKALEADMVDGEWQVSRQSVEKLLVAGMPAPAEADCKKTCRASSCGCK